MNLIKKFRYLVLFLMTVFVAGCENNPVVKDEPHKLSDIKNIYWTLESYEDDGQQIDLSSYWPFQIGFNESKVFGYDGCNSFFCPYETIADSVFPEGCSGTQRACYSGNFSSFSFCTFASPYRYQILLEDRKLLFYRSDEIFTFSSDFINPVDTGLIDKIWNLSSNKLVTLVFEETREFEAEYSWSDTSTVGYGTAGGIYGIGDGSSIKFNYMGGGGSGIEWTKIMNKILRSSSYNINDDLLFLTNDVDSMVFEFSVIE